MRTVSISLVRLLIASVILLVPHASTAQVLGIQGDHFTVSGNPQFLVFISYSDGLRRIPDVSNCNDSLNTNTLKTDLQYLATKRVAGIRVFPNWQDPSSTLMDVTGALRCLQLKKLKALVGLAAQNGLVVDLSFTIDTVKDTSTNPPTPMSATAYKTGMQSVATELLGKKNVLFDLQNELDHGGNRAPGYTVAQWQAYLATQIKPAVRANDPSRLLTVSWTSNYPTQDVFNNIQDNTYDLLADHYGHGSTGGWENDTQLRATEFRNDFIGRGPRRPIYLQEPNRFRSTTETSGFDNNESHYVTAVRQAFISGAAAWTFHNPESGNLSGTTPFACTDNEAVPRGNCLLRHDEQLLLEDLYRSNAHVLNDSTISWGATSPKEFARSDFDVNFHPDLVWQNDTTRQVTVWYMTGAGGNALQGWTYLSQAGVPGWTVVATADFNGDGHPDLVWLNDTTRQVTVWYMAGSQGNALTGWDYLSQAGVPGWTVVATGDFNGDGHPDLVWQDDSTRQVTVWYMGGSLGTTFLGWDWLSQDGKPGVTVVGVADFDGDGHLDLVWQKDSTRDWIIGSLFDVWFQGVSGWKIVGVADFNGDGHPDLVWQRDDSSLREVTVWYMAGAHGDQLQSWTYLANPGVSGWRALVR